MTAPTSPMSTRARGYAYTMRAHGEAAEPHQQGANSLPEMYGHYGRTCPATGSGTRPQVGWSRARTPTNSHASLLLAIGRGRCCPGAERPIGPSRQSLPRTPYTVTGAHPSRPHRTGAAGAEGLNRAEGRRNRVEMSRVVRIAPTSKLLLTFLIAMAALLLVVPSGFALGVQVSDSDGASADHGMDFGASPVDELPTMTTADAGALSGVPPVDPTTLERLASDATGLGLHGMLPAGDSDALGSTGDALTGKKSSGSASTQSQDVPVWADDAVTTGAVALGATGLMGLLFWLKGSLGFAAARLAGAPLFSRIQKGDMLENDGRELLYELIQADPGISLTELSERAGLGWGTTVYHLGRLEQANYVTSMRQGQSRHFFKSGHGAVNHKHAIAMLKNQTAGDMARFLVNQPGTTQSAIAKALGIKAPTVTKYVKRLEGEGLVQVEAAGRSKLIHPTTQLSTALTHVDDQVSPTLGVSDPVLTATREAIVA